ncbi:MAG: class I tRNA ligase family protein, partial [Candidatus Omnitrophota bacterium]
NTLVTAQEIIFFWVARMIMAGFEFMGKQPFKDVYIHGTVRDITGTKMSKSLGNVIDPLDMIEKYGTDALRFSIISITSQGQDVYLSEGKFELGRNFANKIWNASRFILMNLKEEDVNVDLCVFYKASDLSFPDRWILSRFFTTLKCVSKYLDEYKFNEAANSIYEFFWHEFCDWYIEMVKMSIGEKRTQVILFKVLEKSLRMLHPFMPFITEEIWQKLPRLNSAESGSIMECSWPHVQEEMISKDTEEEMKLLIELVTAIRNMRAVWNIEPQRAISAVINIYKDTDAKLLDANADIIKKLSKVSELKVGRFPKPKNSAVSVVRELEIYVPLEGLIDFEKEKARLKKEEAKIEGEMKAIEGRLNDKNFVAKAPEDIVSKQRIHREELAVSVEKLRENLKNIER